MVLSGKLNESGNGTKALIGPSLPLFPSSSLLWLTEHDESTYCDPTQGSGLIPHG